MNIDELYKRRTDFYLTQLPLLRGGVVSFFVAGAVLLAIAGLQVSAAKVWSALLLNTFFLYSIALGGVAFAGMQDVVGAVWGRPIRRLHESFCSFLPWATGILAIFLLCIGFNILGAREVYVWMVNPELIEHFWGKNTWLQVGFMVARDLFALACVLVVALWQWRQLVQRDRAFVEGRDQEAIKMGEEVREKLRYWSAPCLIVYALGYSLLCFDLLMSLAPTWFSTLWAGWLFSIMMQTLMAATLLFMFMLKDSAVGQVYARQQFHDVGKLMHGFTIFFAYLTYAHVLTYWYGNVPEETEYFIHRWTHSPWFEMVALIPLFGFVIPLYALLFKAAKWTAAAAIPLALMILVSQWFTYVLVVAPEIRIAGHHHGWVGWYADLGGLFVVGALFVAVLMRFAKNYPMVSLADPLLKEALAADH